MKQTSLSPLPKCIIFNLHHLYDKCQCNIYLGTAHYRDMWWPLEGHWWPLQGNVMAITGHLMAITGECDGHYRGMWLPLQGHVTAIIGALMAIIGACDGQYRGMWWPLQGMWLPLQGMWWPLQRHVMSIIGVYDCHYRGMWQPVQGHWWPLQGHWWPLLIWPPCRSISSSASWKKDHQGSSDQCPEWATICGGWWMEVIIRQTVIRAAMSQACSVKRTLLVWPERRQN